MNSTCILTGSSCLGSRRPSPDASVIHEPWGGVTLRASGGERVLPAPRAIDDVIACLDRGMCPCVALAAAELPPAEWRGYARLLKQLQIVGFFMKSQN